MGKSSPSCFKILGCGTHSVENEHLQATETERKSSSDRRGWSFRKRSARHRVLSNSVSSELTLSESKSVDIEVEAASDVPVKTPPVIQLTEEKPPTQPETKSSADVTVANEDIHRKDDVILNDEAGIVMIQTAIRGLLAQKMLLKSKNVIKLQAAVRGHLVRNHAVCTLRCIQSIIRIQKRVRARFLMNDSCDLNKMEHQGKPIYVSIEKLLCNAFANQLMDSMPRTKAMYIKCEPLKSEDSSWKWFERWMSVSVASIEEKHETSSAPMDAKTPELSDVIRDDDTPAPGSPPEFAKLKPEWPDSGDASDDDESNQIVYNANDLDRHPETQDSSDKETKKSLSEEEESRIETLETEKKILADEQQQGAEVKKFIRKGSNPVCVAVQSKLEDLSLAAPVVVKSSSFSSYESGLKSSFDKYSSATDQSIRSRDDAAFADGVIISAAAASGIRIGGSECGTELSISSTLDSPDGSEAEISELQPETKAAAAAPYPRNGWSSTENGSQIQEFDEKPKSSIIWESPKPINTPELVNETEPHLEMVSDTSQQQVNKSSLSSSSSSSSPVSQTPASDSSNKARKRKSETGDSHKKEKSQQNQDHSNEQQRSGGRRRNSFGSGKLYQQEARDGHSSGNFLPSYMQATESARAKVIVISSSNGSGRSSPDVIENAKKRHSLPGSNERQESPRLIQGSLSQAQQQNGKGNGGTTQSPQAERKWRR